jgi:hypothetical protein
MTLAMNRDFFSTTALIVSVFLMEMRDIFCNVGTGFLNSR